MRQMKVLILSCGTGEGHNSAAKAIEASLADRKISSDTKDVLTFKNEKTSRKIAALYNTVIKKFPHFFGFVYTLGKIYDDMRLPSPIYKANASYADELYSYIEEQGYDCIICTHLFAMQAMTAVRRKFCLSARCYGIMTDYTIHPFIKDSDLDGYFVPCGQVAEQFIDKGFPKEKLFITGIPVHPKFNRDISKAEARKRLKLPDDKKIIAVMTGSAGCGKVFKLCKRLNGTLNENHLIVVCSGKNKQLKAKLDGAFALNPKFRILAFTPDVDFYMKAADVILSKSGGLSSTEIAVCNVPLVHLKAVPGLETANLKYFSKNGLSLRADTIGKAIVQTRLLLSDEESARTMRAVQKSLISANAVESLTEKITGEMKNEYDFMDNFYSGRIPAGERDVQSDPAQAVIT